MMLVLLNTNTKYETNASNPKQNNETYLLLLADIGNMPVNVMSINPITQWLRYRWPCIDKVIGQKYRCTKRYRRNN